MSDYNKTLENNNLLLQGILNTVKQLPTTGEDESLPQVCESLVIQGTSGVTIYEVVYLSNNAYMTKYVGSSPNISALIPTLDVNKEVIINFDIHNEENSLAITAENAEVVYHTNLTAIIKCTSELPATITFTVNF